MSPATQELQTMQAALDRVRQKLDALKSERDRARALIELQLHISSILCRQPEIITALHECLISILDVTGYAAGGIYIIDNKGELRLIARHGLDPDFVSKVEAFNLESPQMRFVMCGESYFGSYPAFLEDHGIVCNGPDIRQIAIVPLMGQRGAEGCMNIGGNQDIPMDMAEQHAINCIASFMAGAIARYNILHDLKEQKLQFKILSESTKDATAILNEGLVVRGNKSLSQILGLGEDDLEGLPINMLIHPDDLGMYYDLLSGDDQQVRRIRLLTKTQQYVDMAMRVNNLSRVNGYEDCVVIIAHPWQPRN